ncbi:MAG: hypothetical protein ACOYMM_11090, partial [Phycisphaerales bacterium]
MSAPSSIHAPASRSIRVLDSARALSDALCEILVAHHRGAPFDFGRTMVLVPGARLAGALERNLLARAKDAGQPLIAPSIVTPLMLASRFVEPELPVLTPLASRLAWREALERTQAEDPALADEVARVFGVRVGAAGKGDGGSAGEAGDEAAGPDAGSDAAAMDGEMRARFAQRMHRMAAEIAASMHSFDSVLEALRVEREGAQGGDAVDVAAGDSAETRGVTESRGVVDSRGGHTLRNIAVLARLAARRDALLETEGVADRDAALRDAVAGGRLLAPDEAHGADRVVVLLADPEPVQRALLERLGESGVSVEVCVHSVESIDRAGFPQLGAWESRRFPVERIPSSSIRVAEGPAEAADAVVEAIRRLPAPRRSDAIAVMAPDDESRRAIERALALAGAPATRVASRGFPVTRLGTLLARLGDLLGEGTLESLAAFVRHDDVATWL